MEPFSVTNDDLNRLDPKAAVSLIRNMIHLEAFGSGIELSSINVSDNIYAKDGGIDGVVRNAPNNGICGIIKKGTTMYQVKSYKSGPTERKIREILFNGSELRAGMRDCFETGATLVVAFTGWDGPTVPPTRVEQDFLAQIEKEGYPNARIEVWRQNTIIGFLKKFPSLQLSVKGLSGSPLHIHEKWSGMDDMRTQVHLGEKQHGFIRSMRAALRGPDRAPIRVSGEPGIGKTRLVLEATKADDLRPAVVYFEKPSDLEERGFMSYVCGTDLPIEAILVVDECEFSDHASIWNKLKHNAPGILLVTIFIEDGRSAQTMPAPPLEDGELEKIIKSYIGDDPNIRRWTEWCRPSPRAAHVIGHNLKNNPGDLLSPLEEVDVWGRYIAGKETSKEKIGKQYQILLWLSLFRKFGFESPHDGEADRIAKIVELREGIPKGEFMGIVRDLRKSKILQGSTTLYIAPKLLHLYLWREWWKTYSTDMFPKEQDLVPQTGRNYGDGDLSEWCLDMFAYAKTSPEAAEVVRKFLAPGGYMESDATLDTFLGANLFPIFGRADPTGALDYLKRTLCKRSMGDLLEFGAGRRAAVSFLERMASRGERVDDVARVLLKLAEAENEAFGNNATGVFRGMFKMVRPMAKPDYLIRLLKGAMESDSASARKVAVGACSDALDDVGYAFLPEDDGIAPSPQPYEPTRDEKIGYRLQVLGMLRGRGGAMPEGAAEAVLLHAHPLILVPELADSVAEALEGVRADGKNDEELVECVSRMLSICELGEETAERLQAIMDGVSGSSFHSKMRRYVGMSEHVDMISDSARENRKKEFGALAKAAADPKVLEPELEWLVTCDAAQGYQFGYELAGRDPKWRLLPRIMGAMKGAGTNGKSSFAGGYLRRVREKDAARWGAELDAVYESEKARWLLPSLVRMSGVTDESVKKVMRGVRSGKFGCAAMDHVINSGGVSAGTFTECIDLLAESEDGDAAFVALTLIRARLVLKDLPKETTLKILLHGSVLNRTAESAATGRGEWEWKDVALDFLKQHPGDGVAVLEAVVDRMDAHTPLVPELGRGPVMAEIVKMHGAKAWPALARHVGPPTDRKARMLQLWLAGPLFDRGDSVMSSIPISAINAWVGDCAARAAHVASFLPDNFGYISGFLSKYGDREDVQRALCINFGSEGWRGSGAAHYLEKKKEVDGLMAGESDPNILSWLRFYSDHLGEKIKHHSDSEEREL